MKENREEEVQKDCEIRIRRLRECTGMNRREFCAYFDIPYRTVTDWELGKRHAPDYVLRLLEYYIRTEKLFREDEGGGIPVDQHGKNGENE